MGIEKKNFNGGLNSDVEDRLVPSGDYRNALNIRNSKSDGSSEGAIENTKGNVLIPVELPSGENKVIGALDNVRDNTVIYFVYNSLSNHSIFEFDVSTTTVSLILRSSLLKFSPADYINDPFIIGETLFFNDRINNPRSLNIVRAKNNDYPLPFVEAYINVIVNAPGFPAEVIFGDDEDFTVNNVRGKMFQVRYKYVYLDNEESAWSPISKVPLPVDEAQFRPIGYYPLTKNNYINIRFDLGGDYVKRVKIAVREGNTGDFFLAEDFDKTKVDFGATPPLDYDYKFYNDEVYTSLDNDGNSGMRLYDNVPQKADSMSQIDGNKVAFGSITENYDPVEVDMEVIVNTPSSKISTPPSTVSVLRDQEDDDIGIHKDNYRFPSTSTFGGRIFNGSIYEFLGGQKQDFRNINGNNSTPLILQAGVGPVPLSSYSALGLGGLGYVNSTYAPSFISGPVRDRSLYFRNTSSGKIIRSGGSIINEIMIEDPTDEGTRYVLRVDLRYYALGDGDSQNRKSIKIQYVTVIGDTSIDVANALKQELVAKGVMTEGLVDIKVSNSQVVGSGYWSLGASSNVPVGSSLLRIFGEAYVPGDKKGSDPSLSWPVATGADTGAVYYMNSELRAYSNWTLTNKKTLKSGATHGVGLVYYDSPNRSGLTNVSDDKKFMVPFFSERGLGEGEVPNETTLTLKINHTPPSWAKRYQVVYTGNQTVEYLPGVSGYKGFIQFLLKSVASSTVPGAIKANLSNIFSFNDNVPEDVDLNYSFSSGDRIRIITNPIVDETSTVSYLNEYRDVEVISYDDTSKDIVFKDPGISVTDNQLVEIYTPKKNVDSLLYYEVGECFDIIDGQHYGPEQNQTSSQPAIIDLDDIGDVYLRYRVSPVYSVVEDYAYSDYYTSDSWDKGRPNKVDNNITTVKRESTIRFSNNYIPETNINGLSQFDDFDFEEYDQKYGVIQRMYGTDKDLVIFQNLKVGKVRIGQTTLYGNEGTSIATLKSQDKVLSDIVYYAGEYGIGINPESFAVYGNRIYFTDVNRGVVLRLGNDGLTPISEYGMHNYFNDTFKSITNDSGDYKLFGEYDVRFEEYILSIQGDITSSLIKGVEGSSELTNPDAVKDTIAFSESKRKWTTFYSYVPEYMVTNNVGLVSFKDGNIYNHNENSLYNNFYGEQFTSKLRFLSNVSPSSIKVYNSIFLESSHKWAMPSAINQFGQKTSLIVEDFVDDEGVFKSSFLKDENTPNVTLPLIEGDDIRCHSLDVEIESSDVEAVKVFAVGINLTESQLTNR